MTAHFQITNLQDSSVLAVNDMREQIHIDPDYQRLGGVWNIKKRQLFIDSLINRYDIPKLYFHQINGSGKSEKHKYAIIDGRQRLEALWGFIDGKFALENEFEYFDDDGIKAGGMTYAELSNKYPKLAIRLNSRTLTIMIVATEDKENIDIVEDMFSRLNEAVPLNAAEKRNAFGGELPIIVRKLVKRKFFTDKISVSSSRYRHHDIVAKFLYLEYNKNIVSTKKVSLDNFFSDFSKRNKKKDCLELETGVRENITNMEKIFASKDSLLRSSAMVVVYYVLFSQLRRDKCDVDVVVSREKLENFDRTRTLNRKKFESDSNEFDTQLLEFDDMLRASNDSYSIRQRYETLREWLEKQY